MNNIRAIEALNQRELDAGIPPSASWHTDWADTAYIYIGGLPYELSEGDIITIFSQYGEPVHVNLIRDKETGKSKGFAFLKYEDQRSTTLAVDNLGGSNILGRTIRVDHTRYKQKEGDEPEILGATNHEEEADDEGGSRRKRRRDVESPPPLPEELELRKLIAEHDDDDPMKDYLVREKKEEVQKALERRDKKIASRRKRGDHDEERRSHRHRSHRHRSQSRDKRSRRHSPRSEGRLPEGERAEHGARTTNRGSRRHQEDSDYSKREKRGEEGRRRVESRT